MRNASNGHFPPQIQGGQQGFASDAERLASLRQAVDSIEHHLSTGGAAPQMVQSPGFPITSNVNNGLPQQMNAMASANSLGHQAVADNGTPRLTGGIAPDFDAATADILRRQRMLAGQENPSMTPKDAVQDGAIDAISPLG